MSDRLRLEATQRRARAVELERAAVRVRMIADTIRYMLADLSARSRLVWRGPAATDFERRADDADADLRAQASMLVTTAADMDGEARRLRGEAESLEARARMLDSAAGRGIDVFAPAWPNE